MSVALAAFTSQVDGYKIVIRSPRECTQDQINEFITLLAEGNEVDTRGVEARIRRAASLGFAYDGETLIGIAAVKVPAETYRRSIERKSGVELDTEEYPFEAGWLYVKPQYRDQKIGQSLRGLTILAALRLHEGIFSTIRDNNKVAQHILEKFGFSKEGSTWTSERSGTPLALYTKNPGIDDKIARGSTQKYDVVMMSPALVHAVTAMALDSLVSPSSQMPSLANIITTARSIGYVDAADSLHHALLLRETENAAKALNFIGTESRMDLMKSSDKVEPEKKEITVEAAPDATDAIHRIGLLFQLSTGLPDARKELADSDVMGPNANKSACLEHLGDLGCREVDQLAKIADNGADLIQAREVLTRLDRNIRNDMAKADPVEVDRLQRVLINLETLMADLYGVNIVTASTVVPFASILHKENQLQLIEIVAVPGRIGATQIKAHFNDGSELIALAQTPKSLAFNLNLLKTGTPIKYKGELGEMTDQGVRLRSGREISLKVYDYDREQEVGASSPRFQVAAATDPSVETYLSEFVEAANTAIKMTKDAKEQENAFILRNVTEPEATDEDILTERSSALEKMSRRNDAEQAAWNTHYSSQLWRTLGKSKAESVAYLSDLSQVADLKSLSAFCVRLSSYTGPFTHSSASELDAGSREYLKAAIQRISAVHDAWVKVAVMATPLLRAFGLRTYKAPANVATAAGNTEADRVFAYIESQLERVEYWYQAMRKLLNAYVQENFAGDANAYYKSEEQAFLERCNVDRLIISGRSRLWNVDHIKQMNDTFNSTPEVRNYTPSFSYDLARGEKAYNFVISYKNAYAEAFRYWRTALASLLPLHSIFQVEKRLEQAAAIHALNGGQATASDDSAKADAEKQACLFLQSSFPASTGHRGSRDTSYWKSATVSLKSVRGSSPFPYIGSTASFRWNTQGAYVLEGYYYVLRNVPGQATDATFVLRAVPSFGSSYSPRGIHVSVGIPSEGALNLIGIDDARISYTRSEVAKIRTEDYITDPSKLISFVLASSELQEALNLLTGRTEISYALESELLDGEHYDPLIFNQLHAGDIDIDGAINLVREKIDRPTDGYNLGPSEYKEKHPLQPQEDYEEERENSDDERQGALSWYNEMLSRLVKLRKYGATWAEAVKNIRHMVKPQEATASSASDRLYEKIAAKVSSSNPNLRANSATVTDMMGTIIINIQDVVVPVPAVDSVSRLLGRPVDPKMRSFIRNTGVEVDIEALPKRNGKIGDVSIKFEKGSERQRIDALAVLQRLLQISDSYGKAPAALEATAGAMTKEQGRAALRDAFSKLLGRAKQLERAANQLAQYDVDADFSIPGGTLYTIRAMAAQYARLDTLIHYQLESDKAVIEIAFKSLDVNDARALAQEFKPLLRGPKVVEFRKLIMCLAGDLGSSYKREVGDMVKLSQILPGIVSDLERGLQSVPA